jgi:hypothetical protein
MSTESVTLPIVVGGVGAGESVLQLAACKNIIVADLKGTVNIEAKIAGAGWCPVATFNGSTLDQVVEIVANEFRVDASSGSVSSVEVVAERSSVKSGDIPVPPSSGAGAALDASQLGDKITIEVAGKTGSGSINIEASGDDVNYSVIASFNADGCKTVECTAAKFLRAVGNGATASAIGVAAEDPAIGGITSPSTSFVYRPNTTEEATANVYKDWATLVEAVAGVEGRKYIEFIADGAPINIPGGTWLMEDVTWLFPNWGQFDPPGSQSRPVQVFFNDGCKLPRLRIIEAYTQPVLLIGLSSSPVFDDFYSNELFLQGGSGYSIFFNFGSAPIFDLNDSQRPGTDNGITWVVQGGSGYGGAFANAVGGNPVFNLQDNKAFLLIHHACSQFDKGIFSGGGGGGDGGPGPQGIFYASVTDRRTAVSDGNFIQPAHNIDPADHPAYTGDWWVDGANLVPAHSKPTDPETSTPIQWTLGGVGLVDNTAAAKAVTLPPAKNHPGEVISVKALGDCVANPITVNAAAGETVEGGVSYTMNTLALEYAEFVAVDLSTYPTFTDPSPRWILKLYK